LIRVLIIALSIYKIFIMISILRALLFLGASSYVASSVIPRTENSTFPPPSYFPPPPDLQLVFICNLVLDVPDDFLIVTPKYTRVPVPITGGNWTTPEGKLIANVVTGIGGEWGLVDSTGTLYVDSVYFVQFVEDKKYAYSYLQGYGVPYVSDDGRAVVETDSPKYSYFNNISFVAPGLLTGELLVSPHWAPPHYLG